MSIANISKRRKFVADGELYSDVLLQLSSRLCWHRTGVKLAWRSKWTSFDTSWSVGASSNDNNSHVHPAPRAESLELAMAVVGLDEKSLQIAT